MIGWFNSCRKGSDDTAPLARVGDATITMEQARRRLDTSRGISEAQINEYVQRWMVNELLYREALKRGIDQDEAIAERIFDARRQIIVNAFLEREVYRVDSNVVAPARIAGFYEAHKSEFHYPVNVAVLSYAVFADRDSATAFRNDVTQGAAWQTSLAKYASSISARVDSVYCSEASLQPSELWRVAMNFKEREASFPVSAPGGYYVVILWKMNSKGSIAGLPFVYGDVRNRFIIEERRKAYDSLISVLRKQYPVELLMKPKNP
jgi:hypothetical protein